MSGRDDEPTLDVARGDRALSEHLTNSIRLLRDRSEDPEFQRLADDIVAGRTSLRDATASPVLASALNPGVAQFAERYETMSDAEREELAKEGDRQFTQRNEQLERGRARPSDDDDGDDGVQNSFLG